MTTSRTDWRECGLGVGGQGPAQSLRVDVYIHEYTLYNTGENIVVDRCFQFIVEEEFGWIMFL